MRYEKPSFFVIPAFSNYSAPLYITETYMELQAKGIINGLSDVIAYNVEIDEVKKLIEYQ